MSGEEDKVTYPVELVLVVVIGFLMAWAVGANDVANAIAIATALIFSHFPLLDYTLAFLLVR